MSLRTIRGELVDMPETSIMGSEFIIPDQRNWGEYDKFLAGKQIRPVVSGLTAIPRLHRKMFPFQRDVTQWALKLGRSVLAYHPKPKTKAAKKRTRKAKRDAKL